MNALTGLLQHSQVQGLTVVGLMTVGPTDGDSAVARRAFRATAQRARELGLHEVSMGMTADLELAIECGSTMVRVGSAIFGDRPPMTDK